MIDLVEIGFVKKTFGAEGAMKVAVEDRFFDDYKNCEFIFIQLSGGKIPFLIIDKQKNSSILSLEDIDSPEIASSLVGKKILIERSMISNSSLSDVGSTNEELISFDLHNSNEQNESVGKISDIQEFPEQIMLIVNRGSSEIMIPLTETWLESIDPDEKIIVMALPAGLY